LSNHIDAGIEDPGEHGRPAPRVSERLLRILTAVLALVLVAGVAVAVWFEVKVRDADRDQRQRAEAVAAASQFAVRMDTFDGKKMDAYSKSVQQLLTTKYKSEFDKQFQPFKQVYTQAQAVGTGKVVMSGVSSFDPDSATVLVVHDGSVKSKLGQSQVRHQRWSVDLVKVGGRWLIDDFSPVN
jgi:Mce-associated membrane protein